MDDCTKIAISMQSNKGVYALLLGSGISVSAGIPTAWAITKDLVHKLAAALGEEIAGDWDTWYRNKYSEEELKSHLSKRIAEYKIPSRIIIYDELPLTANGKIDAKLLKEQVKER